MGVEHCGVADHVRLQASLQSTMKSHFAERADTSLQSSKQRLPEVLFRVINVARLQHAFQPIFCTLGVADLRMQ